MNYGPLIFLAAFFAFAASWFGFVLTPQMQVGHLQQTNTVPAQAPYPLARPGLARDGLEVYRANGCAYCHSQQVRQTGVACNVVLSDVGTNQAAVVKALLDVKAAPNEAAARQMLVQLPHPILVGQTKPAADAAAKDLTSAGAKAQVWVIPEGPEIARGWGKRRTVAEDFAFDYPVLLGSQRVGPDLANVGLRMPDVSWHLRHLYAPRGEVPGSIMPPYKFLFEKRRMRNTPSAEALSLPGGMAPEPGYEIVPTRDARALVEYVLSLRASEPLFVAPLTVVEPAAAPSTNEPAGQGGTATNAPATNSPAGK